MDAVDKGESKDGVMLLLKSFVSIIPRTPTNNCDVALHYSVAINDCLLNLL